VTKRRVPQSLYLDLTGTEIRSVGQLSTKLTMLRDYKDNITPRIRDFAHNFIAPHSSEAAAEFVKIARYRIIAIKKTPNNPYEIRPMIADLLYYIKSLNIFSNSDLFLLQRNLIDFVLRPPEESSDWWQINLLG
jgi:hypothetical protein